MSLRRKIANLSDRTKSSPSGARRSLPVNRGSNGTGEMTLPSAPVRDLLRDLRERTMDLLLGCGRRDLLRRETHFAFSHARMIACYAAHVGAGVSLRAIAAATGRHPSTIAALVRLIETRRDDPAYDRLVGEIERIASAMNAGGLRHG